MAIEYPGNDQPMSSPVPFTSTSLRIMRWKATRPRSSATLTALMNIRCAICVSSTNPRQRFFSATGQASRGGPGHRSDPAGRCLGDRCTPPSLVPHEIDRCFPFRTATMRCQRMLTGSTAAATSSNIASRLTSQPVRSTGLLPASSRARADLTPAPRTRRVSAREVAACPVSGTAAR